MNENFKLLVLNTYHICEVYFAHLIPLELEGKQNTEEYEYYLNKLRILKKKEQRLTQDEVYIVEELAINQYLPEGINPITKNLVNQRLSYIIEKNAIQLDDSLIEFYFESEEEEAELYANNQSTINNLETVKYIYLDYLRHIEKKTKENPRLIKQKYELAFTNPDLETELTPIAFNISSTIDDKEFRPNFMGVTEEEYEEIENETLHLLIEELLYEIHDGTLEEVQNNLEFFAYLFNNLKDEDKEIIKETIIYISETSLPYLQYKRKSDVTEIILSILDSYKGKSDEQIFEEIDRSQNISRIDPEKTDILFELIKKENKIYTTIQKLELVDRKEKQRLKNKLIILLQKELDEESELLEKLTLSEEEVEELLEIISTSLNIITNEEQEDINKTNCFIRRIYNLFNTQMKNDEYFLGKESVYQEFETESLKRYQKIRKSKNNNKHLIGKEYEEIFCVPTLTRQYTMFDGDLSKSIKFDSNFSSMLYNISEEEYNFDRDEILLSIAKGCIETLSNTTFKTNEEKANEILIKIKFDTAIKELSKHNLEIIKEIAKKGLSKQSNNKTYILKVINKH